ncbi:MAG TPA: winged helix-turn-helix transcriptional regulator [Solirubrobacterales bacterium]
MRAGAYGLSLLSVPLNVHVLTALQEEPLSLIELRRAVGSPPQTTVRGHLKNLTALGVIERRRAPQFPGAVDYELGEAGRSLLEVAEALEAWLRESPDGPLELGGLGARSAIKALIDGWDSAIVRVLAAKPLSLTELNRLISELNYPSLERRLGAMRLAGQIEAAEAKGRGTPYALTPWLRTAVAPICAAARWERRYAPTQAAPIAKLDVEAGLLSCVPLLELPEETGGLCRLAVQLGGSGGEPTLAGVVVGIKEGRVFSCVTRLSEAAEAWAVGSANAWMSALIDGDSELLEVGGDCGLTYSVLEGLHGVLFRARQSAA